MAMYGSLLGAVRDNDHLPHTRDVDLVVDSSDWARIAEELSRRTFAGGRRRYIAAVDQWDSKVLRICADYFGWDPVWFSSDERDDSRDFVSVHLDLYDEGWWAVRDLKLMGCMVPNKTSIVSIRELNLSAMAFPEECLEKLYGVDWRETLVSLGGVN
ncbi:hypothetical protein FOZ63_014937 [Perkinsus olseni]|uniref:Uncharacterized protein n=1 Tax=Perkinsus olseni TaxID=32597 RepID=A0A7J6Q3T9_PEROL|nr:hypothetical protein FOZ63_014937 [Perkinsus olseni]